MHDEKIKELIKVMENCQRILKDHRKRISENQTAIKRTNERLIFNDAKTEMLGNRINSISDKIDTIHSKLDQKITFDKAERTITERNIKKYIAWAGLFFSSVAVVAGHFEDLKILLGINGGG